MKRKSAFTLSVPQPCTESWKEMTPDEQGRFCQHCQKTVIDFSNMTDNELVNYFSGTSGKICGRFMPEQLNREMVIPSESRKPFISIAAMLSALYLFIPGTKAASRPMTTQAPGQKADTTGPATEHVPLNLVLTGTVVSSELGDSLPYVTVRVKNASIGTQTDNKGHFRLVLPASYTDTSVMLVFSVIGFYKEEMSVSLLHQEPICIALSSSVRGLTGDIVIAMRPQSRWQKVKWRVKSIFR